MASGLYNNIKQMHADLESTVAGNANWNVAQRSIDQYNHLLDMAKGRDVIGLDNVIAVEEQQILASDLLILVGQLLITVDLHLAELIRTGKMEPLF